jgi:hypothetical protein
MSQSVTIADAWIEEEDDIQWPPCDLLSDEPPLETDFHRDQIAAQGPRHFARLLTPLRFCVQTH